MSSGGNARRMAHSAQGLNPLQRTPARRTSPAGQFPAHRGAEMARNAIQLHALKRPFANRCNQRNSPAIHAIPPAFVDQNLAERPHAPHRAGPESPNGRRHSKTPLICAKYLYFKDYISSAKHFQGPCQARIIAGWCRTGRRSAGTPRRGPCAGTSPPAVAATRQGMAVGWTCIVIGRLPNCCTIMQRGKPALVDATRRETA